MSFHFFDSLEFRFRTVVYDVDYTFAVEKYALYLEEYRALNNSCQTMTSNYFAFFTYKIFPVCDLKILILGLPIITFHLIQRM